MIRNGLGILCFILSGFFVYMIGLLAFVNLPDIGSTKFIIMGVTSVPMIIFHLIGLAFYKDANWKTPTGITLFVGGALNILVIISILSIKASPEIEEVMGTSSLNIFSDYILGFIVMAVFIGLGAILYFLGRRANKLSNTDAINSHLTEIN